MEERLRRDAVGESESRAGNRRIIKELPLTAYFALDAVQNVATVLTLQRVPRRQSP
jgi:hypothetical protein